MIKEDYVSFEVAKLLKEKGFDWASRLWYNNNGIVSQKYIEPTNSILGKDEHFPCVTNQMAMKWLREEHGIIITIDFDEYELTSDNKEVGYGYNIQKVETPTKYFTISTMVYDSYEEACEAAIKYCLTNLI